jgi:hypothetical protein
MARSATKQRIAQAQNGANRIGDKERRFFDALKNIFVGVPVEGESGYINLMRIKARYFEKVMEPRLRDTIDTELQHFPDFREELFDKLYTFFRRYFTESGSIGFFFTPTTKASTSRSTPTSRMWCCSGRPPASTMSKPTASSRA